MSLIKLARTAFPDAWLPPTNADDKARAVAATVSLLCVLRHDYGGGQVNAVVTGLLGDGADEHFVPRGG